jgi:arylesterase / paraoxonase
MLKRWLKRLGWGLLALLLMLGVIVFDTLRHGGQFSAFTPAFAGSCVAVPLEASAEDIQIDRARGVAYLSYLDRRGKVQGRVADGTVLLLDLNVADARPRPALASNPAAFHPHGMSLYRAGDGTQRLFVISHPPGQGHAIETFEQTATGAFAPLGRITDPLLVSPNAVVAVGPNQFYVANDRGARNGFERGLELLFRRGLSTVTYFDGQSMRVAATDLKSAAGIAASPDGGTIYVAETAGKRVSVFRRDAATGTLTLVERLGIDGAPDNLHVAADGAVWVAAHAKTLALVNHFRDEKQIAPSLILRIATDPKATPRVAPVYANLGEQISAGSVGAVHAGELLIGSITERRILRCRLPQASRAESTMPTAASALAAPGDTALGDTGPAR